MPLMDEMCARLLLDRTDTAPIDLDVGGVQSVRLFFVSGGEAQFERAMAYRPGLVDYARELLEECEATGKDLPLLSIEPDGGRVLVFGENPWGIKVAFIGYPRPMPPKSAGEVRNETAPPAPETMP